MKILIVHPGPQFSVADVCNGWANALGRLGCEVQTYNLDDRLAFYGSVEINGKSLHYKDVIELAAAGIKTKCYEYEPDVVLVVSGFFVPDFTWNLWRRKSNRTVLLCTESPYEDDRQLTLIEQADPDVVLVNDPINLDRYKQTARRVYYMPHAYDPDIHYPTDQKPECDFAFVGTGYPSRIELFEQVDWTGLNIRLAGNWAGLADTALEPLLIHPLDECYPNDQTADLYRSAKVSANLYRANRRADLEANRPHLAQGWAMGPREVELAACGTFFLREPRGEGDQLFPMLPKFSEAGEFSDLLRWHVDHDMEREQAAADARAAVQYRTFDVHARRLLRLIPD